MTEHRSVIRKYNLEKDKIHKEGSKWRETGVARHFSEMSHNLCDLRWQIIEEIYGKNINEVKKRLLQREVFWIFALETLSPNGLNEECNWHVCH